MSKNVSYKKLDFDINENDLLILNDPILDYKTFNNYRYTVEVIKLVLLDTIRFKMNINNESDSVLAVVEKYKRKYDSNWTSIREIYSFSNTLDIIHKPYKFNYLFLKDFYNAVKYYLDLNSIRDNKLRIFLSLKLSQKTKISQILKRIFKVLEVKNVVFYYDGSFESKIIQSLLKGTSKSTTFIHSYNSEYSVNDIIRPYMNINSDYIVSDGKFHFNQLRMQGFDKEKIIFSNYKQLIENKYTLIEERSNLCLLFFESPLLKSYNLSKSLMLEIAKILKKDKNYRCLIRPHPTDLNPRNLKILDGIEIADSKINLDDLVQIYKPEFAIIGDSSIYVDLLVRKIKAFQIISQGVVSIIRNEFDIAENYRDLNQKLGFWRVLDLSTKNEHFEKELNYFHGEKDNAKILFNSFKD